MANFKIKDKKLIPEFVGSLMKAVARRGAGKTIKKLEKDPIIKKHIQRIQQVDKDLQDYIAKRSKTDSKFKKDYDDALDYIKSL